MLTRCPHCSTTFRVSPPQLKARAGTVRCGQCSHVFNALDTLADDPVSVPADMAEPPLEEQTAPPAAEEAPIEAVEAIAADSDEIAVEEIPPAIVAADPEPEPVVETEEPLPEPIPESAPAETENFLAEPLLHETVAPRRRWPWVLGSLVALLGLLSQAAYYYRVELAVLRPELRPLLQTACESLRCEVPRPRGIDLLGIEASDLRPDPRQTGHLTLNATLRSKAPYAQEWPLLELTLTDVADRKLAVRGFAPGDYLPKDKNSAAAIAAGFPANGEIVVSLPLDVGDLPAVGYRLYIFYP